MTGLNATPAIRTARWQPSRLRRLLGQAAYPLIRLINRPTLAWLGRGLYDFALRCNGIAINFPGRHGLSQPEEAFLKAHVQALQGGVLFDVGANRGAYALLLHSLAPSARIVAFEPHPVSFAALQRTLHGTTVECLNRAVSDQAGTLTLHDFAAEDGSTQASLDAAAVEMYSAEVVTHQVATITIDAMLAELGIDRIALLKVDTEGHDVAVLRGAADAIRTRRIGLIQFEFIPANIATHVTMRDMFEALPGYRIHRLCLNGALLPLDPYDVKSCEIYVTQNLVAVPC